MDVVKTNIEAMQGEILVETNLGKGSTFKVVLPLTLAIIDGMIVTTNNERFVIPLSHVHESVRPQPQDLKWVTGIGEVMLLRGENLPLYRMEHLLNKKTTSHEATNCIALVIRIDQKPFAVLVDDILGQHQVVIKKLGDELAGVKGFSGSTALGDGRPSLILELGELISKGTKQVATPPVANNKQDTNNTRRAVA
jgi:two-component system chemotaxis sensor kinase CheA